MKHVKTKVTLTGHKGGLCLKEVRQQSQYAGDYYGYRYYYEVMVTMYSGY